MFAVRVSIPLAIFTLLAAAMPLKFAAAAGVSAMPCWGTIQVTPHVVRLNGSFTISGAHYTCKTPGGQLGVPTTILMYRPNVGAAIIDLTAAATHSRGGAYRVVVRVPRRLVTMAWLRNPAPRKTYVPTRPGNYSFDVQTFGIAPPVAGSIPVAHIHIVR